MTNGKNKRVIGVGLAVLDQLLIWEDTALPVQDNSIVASDLQGGGMAATAMVAVTRLGCEAELWTAVGDDWVGEQIVQGLRNAEVDTSQVLKVVGGNSWYMIVCIDKKSGERYFKAAKRWDQDQPHRAIGDTSRLASAGCLLIDHALPQSEMAAATEAHKHGVPVVSDTGRITEWQAEILPLVDYAIVSEQCARTISDDLEQACWLLRQSGAGCVVITLGAEGLVYLDGETYGSLPAFRVEVVDTTGAGDVFHGAFCYGLVQGFPLEYNLRFCSATSALKCGQLGGRAGIPTRAQVDAFLQQQGVNLYIGA